MMEKIKAWFNGLSSPRKAAVGFVVIVILLAIGNAVFANEVCDRRTVVVDNSNYVENSITNEVNRGVSLSMAMGGLQYNLASKDPQWSVGGAKYDGDGAIAGGVGMKLDNVFVSLSVGRQDSHTGAAVGFSGKF